MPQMAASCYSLCEKSRLGLQFSTACRARMRNGDIATPSTSLWIGADQSRGCPSASPLSSLIGCTWKHDNSPHARSVFGWEPCAAWRTRRQVADFSAPTQPQEYGESLSPRNRAFGLVTGWPQSKHRRPGEQRTANRSRGNEIAPCRPYRSPADFAATNSPSFPYVTCSSVKAFGQSWTCVERQLTFEQLRFRIGCTAY